MIDLVLQIRRAAPEDYRPEIKFTNPDLLNALKSMSDQVENDGLKTAVQNLLQLVDSGGKQPPVAGRDDRTPPAADVALSDGSSQPSSRVYRGQRVAR